MPDKTTKKLKKSSKKLEKIDEKSERFIRVVGKRAQFVINKLFTMGKILDNSYNYTYNLEQVDLIFQPIEDLVAKLKERFIEKISKEDVRDSYRIDLALKTDERSN